MLRLVFIATGSPLAGTCTVSTAMAGAPVGVGAASGWAGAALSGAGAAPSPGTTGAAVSRAVDASGFTGRDGSSASGSPWGWCGGAAEAQPRASSPVARMRLSVFTLPSLGRRGDLRHRALARREDLDGVEVGGVAAGGGLDPDAVHARLEWQR